jgi:lichenan operon transcriptional antiterminator
MLLNKNERLILEYLFKNKGKYCTSKNIAKDLGYSDRTIRQYIKGLINTMGDFGAYVLAKQGFGYILVIKNHHVFNEYFFKKIN